MKELPSFSLGHRSVEAKFTQYRHAVDTALIYFGLGKQFTLPDLLDAMRNTYKCPIELFAYPNMPTPYTGTTFVTPQYIAIYYRGGVAVSHAYQIICHEIVHILRGHEGHDCAQLQLRWPSLFASLPALNLEGQIRICNRTQFDRPEEFEAEYSGTYLATKLIPTNEFISSLIRM
jgi:hypothetical protein